MVRLQNLLSEGDEDQTNSSAPLQPRTIQSARHFRPRLVLAMALTSILASAKVMAQQNFPVTTFGQISIAQKEHDFDQLLDQGLSFYMIHLGGGLTYHNFYVSINGAWSINDASVSEEEETGEASRTDYDLTLGINLTDHITIFGGYKLGKTDIDFTARDAEENATAAGFSDSFEESGPYLGASWQYYFDNSSKISFSLAYAWLDAKNNLGAKPDDDDNGATNNGGDAEEFEFDDFTGRVDSDANGFSIGLRWSIPLGNQLGYYALFRVQRYSQDLEQNGTKVSVDEQFNELGMGLTYLF